jgi:hypothetical protein
VRKLRLFGLLCLAALVAAALAGGAASRSDPTCAPTAVLLRIDTNGAGGKVLIYSSLVNRGRRACVTHGRLGVSLRNAGNDRLLAVAGNPFAANVNHRLRIGRTILFTLEWRNYCGPVTVMRFESTFGSRTARTPNAYPAARCDDLSAQSRLRLLKRG